MNTIRSTYFQKDESFGDRLKSAIGDQSIRSFSNKCGISNKTVRQYILNEVEPSREKVERMSEVLSVSPGWLGFGEVSSSVSENPTAYGFDKEYSYISELHVDPQVGIETKRVAFRREWLEQRHLEARNLAVVRHRGDTMQPTLLDGDALLIRVFHHKDGDAMRLGLESITSIDDGLYLVKIGSTQKVLRVCLRSTDQLQLISDNDRYPPRLVSLTEDASPAEITIVGSVLWIGRWLNH